MNIFGFGTYFSLLGHCVRLHIEANTYYNWFDWQMSYDESLNGIRIMIEFLKIQTFIGIGSNTQDIWFFDSGSYFIQQEHNKIPKELQELQNQQIANIEADDENED